MANKTNNLSVSSPKKNSNKRTLDKTPSILNKLIADEKTARAEKDLAFNKWHKLKDDVSESAWQTAAEKWWAIGYKIKEVEAALSLKAAIDVLDKAEADLNEAKDKNTEYRAIHNKMANIVVDSRIDPDYVGWPTVTWLVSKFSPKYRKLSKEVTKIATNDPAIAKAYKKVFEAEDKYDEAVALCKKLSVKLELAPIGY